MKILVKDTETTGFNTEGHTVVELAGVILEQGEITKTFTTLVAPGRRIPPEAMAVHHIRDEDVRDAPHLPAAVQQMLEAVGDYNCTAAHNAPFDMFFLRGHLPQKPVIDTLKCARHVFPDERGYSNQALRYSLNLDFECRQHLDKLELTAHRALYDTLVTAVLLRRLLKERDCADLIDLSTRPVLQKMCNFGNKHRGQPWNKVPKDYLRWMLRLDDLDPDVRHTVEHWSRT